MRILYVTEFLPDQQKLTFTGGIETALYYLLKYIPEDNQITVLYRPQPGQQLPSSSHIRYIPCGPPASSSAFTITSLIGRISFFIQTVTWGFQYQYDLVIGTNFTTYLQAFIIGKLRARKTAALYADVLKGEWIQHFGIFLGTCGEVLESIILLLPWDAYFPISQSTADKLMQHKIPSSKIYVQHLGVDIQSFQSIKVSKKKKNHIISIARLVPYKRLQDLIASVIILREKHQLAATLEIIGKGPYLNALKDMVEKQHLKGSVIFSHGIPRPELITRLKQASLFSLPSIVEGFGLVTLEALASQTPYVNSDIPANREITHHGQGGLLFQPKNPQDLADKIALLLTNQDLYTEKQKEAKHLIKTYDWQVVVTQTFARYQKLLNTL